MYFLTCLSIDLNIGTIEFRNIITQVGYRKYPISFNILASVGLWGTPGRYRIRFSLLFNGKCAQLKVIF